MTIVRCTQTNKILSNNNMKHINYIYFYVKKKSLLVIDPRLTNSKNTISIVVIKLSQSSSVYCEMERKAGG